MPRIGITAYDLLISCPGDVIEYLDVIKESVESFNSVFGSIEMAKRGCGQKPGLISQEVVHAFLRGTNEGSPTVHQV